MTPDQPAPKRTGIQRAALEISYDCGGINRYRTEAQMLRKLAKVRQCISPRSGSAAFHPASTERNL